MASVTLRKTIYMSYTSCQLYRSGQRRRKVYDEACEGSWRYRHILR
jgi:hypothetical protein